MFCRFYFIIYILEYLYSIFYNMQKELFINGIGKNGDELISLFEIGSIVSDKDAN